MIVTCACAVNQSVVIAYSLLSVDCFVIAFAFATTIIIHDDVIKVNSFIVYLLK